MSATFEPPSPPDDPARLRTPPHSIEAEQGVLGGLLVDGAALGRISDVIIEADFYRHEHRVIFGAIERVIRRGSPVDVVTVFEQLEGETHDFGGLPYLQALAQTVPNAANIRRYAEIVAERATLRQIIAEADAQAAAAFNTQGRTAAELLERAGAALRQIADARKAVGRKLPLLALAELRQTYQAARWLIKHVMPADSIGMIYGASGTFKSFIALDSALHVAHGLPWLGRKTLQGPVIYVAAEGGSGLWNRIQAWHQARRLRWQEAPVYVLPLALDLRADAWRVVEAAQALGLTPAQVVVDTLSQTYSGEENSADEMAAYLREIGARFRGLWGCTVLLVHHSGHTATERPRGSSAIRANVDFLYGVFRDGKEMLATLICEKQKDGDRVDDATFSLASHTLGVDDDGERITSLVARHLVSVEDVQEAQAGEKAAGRSGNNQLFLSLVQNGMREKELRKVFYDECLSMAEDTRRKAYFRARAWAVKAGLIDIAQGIIITLTAGQK